MKLSGQEISRLRRVNETTIGQLARRMQITRIRIREIRKTGLTNANAVRDWVQAITGTDPGPM